MLMIVYDHLIAKYNYQYNLEWLYAPSKNYKVSTRWYIITNTAYRNINRTLAQICRHYSLAHLIKNHNFDQANFNENSQLNCI